MDRLIERVAVGLSDITSRRGFLGRVGRIIVGIGVGVTTLAGGPAFASLCGPANGTCGSCSDPNRVLVDV
jgi:hypothetical protein